MDAIFDLYISLIEWIFGLLRYDYKSFATILKPISFILSLVFGFLIIWGVIKFRQIMKSMKTTTSLEIVGVPKSISENIESWQKILERGKSLDESERKFAIIEADTLIDKILGMAGYNGENLGAKLKQVERGDIESLDDLWEAHKIRNRIAHEANFKLSPESAGAAISRYEKVLKELEYI